ncbi:MAG: hypothetical protein JWM44_2739 [Bacilli bacterium]|nr:hypothetical protein [Bacilli bacterium]
MEKLLRLKEELKNEIGKLSEHFISNVTLSYMND